MLMATLSQYLKKVQSINVRLSSQVAMEKTAATAVAEQKKQLAQGLRSDDTLMPEYSFRSVFQYGKTPGPITLYDTGAFYSGILFDVRSDIYIMDSADSKTTMLENRYGREILGLGSVAKRNYIRILRPELVSEIKSYLK